MASCGDIEIASRPPLTSMISAIFTMTIFDELEPYYAQHLSARELRQFHKAEGAGPCGLLTRIIQPNAYRPERRSYMGVEQRMDSDRLSVAIQVATDLPSRLVLAFRDIVDSVVVKIGYIADFIHGHTFFKTLNDIGHFSHGKLRRAFCGNSRPACLAASNTPD